LGDIPRQPGAGNAKEKGPVGPLAWITDSHDTLSCARSFI